MQWNIVFVLQRVSNTKPRPNPKRYIKELIKMRTVLRKKLETSKDLTKKYI